MSIFKSFFKKSIEIPVNFNKLEFHKNESIELPDLTNFSHKDVKDLFFVFEIIEVYLNQHYKVLDKVYKWDDFNKKDKKLFYESTFEMSIILFVFLIRYTNFGNKSQELKDIVFNIVILTFSKYISITSHIDDVISKKYTIWFDFIKDLKSKESVSPKLVSKLHYYLIRKPLTIEDEVDETSRNIKEYVSQMSNPGVHFIIEYFSITFRTFTENINKKISS